MLVQIVAGLAAGFSYCALFSPHSVSFGPLAPFALPSGSATRNAVAIACILMVMIYATGPISGGNLHLAVSLALGLAGKNGVA